MREKALRDFFDGKIGVAALRRDLDGTVTRTSHRVFTYRVVDMEGEFMVSTAHLTALCDAVLMSELPPQDLSVIAFALEASDQFQWDFDSPEGERIGETVADWSSPEINYPLTLGTVAKFRHRLVTGEDTFTSADLSKQQTGGSET
jgi:hypothetical protein